MGSKASTPLQDACASGDDAAVARCLTTSALDGLARESRVRAEVAADPDGLLPMHLASGARLLKRAENNDTESIACLEGARADDSSFAAVVALLAERSAGVNVTTDAGWTPLHFACACGLPRVVAELVARGAYMTRNEHGLLPIDLLASYSPADGAVPDLSNETSRTACLQALISSGAMATAAAASCDVTVRVTDETPRNNNDEDPESAAHADVRVLDVFSGSTVTVTIRRRNVDGTGWSPEDYVQAHYVFGQPWHLLPRLGSYKNVSPVPNDNDGDRDGDGREGGQEGDLAAAAATNPIESSCTVEFDTRTLPADTTYRFVYCRADGTPCGASRPVRVRGCGSARSDATDSESVVVAPWVLERERTDDPDKAVAAAMRAHEVEQGALALSTDPHVWKCMWNKLAFPPPDSFEFDYKTSLPQAKAALREDPRLQAMRFKLVPSRLAETEFWRAYFYRIELLKQGIHWQPPAGASISTGAGATTCSTGVNTNAAGVEGTGAGPDADTGAADATAAASEHVGDAGDAGSQGRARTAAGDRDETEVGAP